MSDWIVKIDYKHKNPDTGELETVVEKEFDFIQYTELLHVGLMRAIKDIEDAFYYLSGNKQKEEWDDELKQRFQGIRHKLLDEANSIKRLPQNLSYKGVPANQISASEFISRYAK